MSKTLRTSCRLMTKFYFSVVFFFCSRHLSQSRFSKALLHFQAGTQSFYLDENQTKYCLGYCARISSLVCNFALILLIRQPLGHETLLVVTNWWPHKGVTVFL